MSLAFAVSAAEPRVRDADARAIRAVVQGQLDAIAQNDGAKAFSYASPGIRAQFGIPEIFMAMVREGYAVMLRPASVSFLPPAIEAGQTIQRVRMTDDGGRLWLARYVMEKQKGGAWRRLQPRASRRHRGLMAQNGEVPKAFW
jgi:hypothetical protein